MACGRGEVAMPAEAAVALAHGIEWGGGRARAATIRPLSGADQATLAEAAASATPAELATMLIACATCSIGPVAPVTVEIARQLTVGDRERLLLALHRATFGGQLELVTNCPAIGCGATMEVALAVDRLLTGLTDEVGEAERTPEVRIDGEAWTVRARLPNGADQEAAARLARTDPGGAGDLVLGRCLIDADGVPDDAFASLRKRVEQALGALDPATEITLSLTCPRCGRVSAALLDAATLIAAELVRGDGIFVEVDRLARAYHWSEADILALPVARRRRYLELIAIAESFS